MYGKVYAVKNYVLGARQLVQNAVHSMVDGITPNSSRSSWSFSFSLRYCNHTKNGKEKEPAVVAVFRNLSLAWCLVRYYLLTHIAIPQPLCVGERISVNIPISNRKELGLHENSRPTKTTRS